MTLVLGMALWPLPRDTVGTGAVYTTVAVVAAAAFTGHTAPTREPGRCYCHRDCWSVRLLRYADIGW